VFVIGIINDTTISEFQLNLSYESWDNVFNGDDVDIIFNNFLNTYLRIFYHTFLLKKCQHNYNNKQWKTPVIIISSQHKRLLYLLCRSSKDSKLNNYYKKYCRILSDIIKTAKKGTIVICLWIPIISQRTFSLSLYKVLIDSCSTRCTLNARETLWQQCHGHQSR